MQTSTMNVAIAMHLIPLNRKSAGDWNCQNSCRYPPLETCPSSTTSARYEATNPTATASMYRNGSTSHVPSSLVEPKYRTESSPITSSASISSEIRIEPSS